MELDEMIPVDQFFEDYLTRLQSSALSEDLNPYAVGGTHRRPSRIPLDAIPPPEGGGEVPMSRGEVLQGGEDYGGVSGPPVQYSAFATTPPLQGYSQPLNGPPAQSSGLYMDPVYYGEPRPSQGPPPLYDSTEGMGDYGTALPFTQTTEAPPFLTGDALREGDGIFGHDMTDTSSGQTGKKSRPKSARQQQLNKLAQQRYRERKKAKALGLQQTVDALTEQLKQMNAVKEEKLALEEKTLMLERRLIEKEAELQSVKSALEEAKRGSGNNTSELPGADFEKSFKAVGLDSKPAKLFHKKVMDLEKYLKNNNLDPSLMVNPLNDSIPKKVVDDIYQLVGDVCMTCMQLTRYEGPDLWELITASLDSKQRETLDRVMWRSIAQSLKLGKDQISSALTLREQHLAKLEKIYVQRQTLNLEAIQHLLPADQGGRAPVATPLGCLNVASFVQRLRHTAKLNSVLDRLKENLSKEQKLNSELEYMTFYRVMSPLQGAWFTVSAYPHQCDCLEFLNAVSELYASGGAAARVSNE